MRFNDYVSQRQQLLQREAHGDPLVPKAEADNVRKLTSKDYADQVIAAILKRFQVSKTARPQQEESYLHKQLVALRAEQLWYSSDRPYYNVWPIVYDIMKGVKLTVRWSDIALPYQGMLFRFPAGQELLGCHTMLLAKQTEIAAGLPGCVMYCSQSPSTKVPGQVGQAVGVMPLLSENEDQTIEQALEESVVAYEADTEQERVIKTHTATMFRLAAFAALLVRGEDLITPVILSKDRERWQKADDAERKWLEQRAASRGNPGFDIGRKCQEAKDRNPHYRNPHLCLFWTGQGRGVPLVKERRGGIVKTKALTDVPTGFLGAETAEELAVVDVVYTRVPIPKSLRYEVLHRDGFRCQACGATHRETRLHIDHIVPVSRGGSTVKDNLQVLCEACNLGKSDHEF
jgi:hypothetical protein